MNKAYLEHDHEHKADQLRERLNPHGDDHTIPDVNAGSQMTGAYLGRDMTELNTSDPSVHAEGWKLNVCPDAPDPDDLIRKVCQLERELAQYKARVIAVLNDDNIASAVLLDCEGEAIAEIAIREYRNAVLERINK